MRAFIRSVLGGAVVAAVPFILLISFIAVGVSLRDTGVLATLGILLLPLAVTIPITLVSALLIGLPTTVLLRRAHRESGGAYLLCGGLAGGLVAILLVHFLGEPSGLWLGSLGVIAGGATGWTWWRHTRAPTVPATP